MIGALIGAGGSILSSTIGAIAGAAEQKKQNKFNADEAEKNRKFQSEEAALARDFNSAEAEKARTFNAEQSELARQYNTAEREATQQWNLEQWHRENEYNSPAAQMERLMAAGLNPNAAAGMMTGGNSTGNLVSSPQSSGAASGPSASAGAPGGSSASSVGMSGISGLIGNSANSALQAASNAMQTVLTGKEVEWFDKRQKAEIDKIWSDVKLNSVSSKEKDLIVNNFQRMNDAQYNILLEQRNKVKAEIDGIYRTQDREDRLADSTIDVNESIIDKNTADTSKIKSEKAGQDIENIIRGAYSKIVESDPNITLDQWQAMVHMSDEDWQTCSDRFVQQQTKIVKEQGRQHRRNKWNDVAADVVGATVQGLVDYGMVKVTKGGYAVAKINPKTNKPYKLSREQEAAANEWNHRVETGQVKPGEHLNLPDY